MISEPFSVIGRGSNLTDAVLSKRGIPSPSSANLSFRCTNLSHHPRTFSP